MSIGVYVPGQSLLHRAGPGAKLLALTVYAVAISLADSFYVLAGLAGVLIVAWSISGVTWARLAQALRPVLWLLALLFLFQLVITSRSAAIDVLITLTCLIVAAALISHTTRTQDMLETLQNAFSVFARLGVNAQACAFAIVFTIRLVPFIAAVGCEAINARIARGASRNPLAAVVPVVIRLMRESDALAEALVARGFGRA